MKGKRIVFILILLNFLVWLAIGWNNPQISAENGWLETFQAICLFTGAVILAASFYFSVNGSSQLLYTGLTIFYLNFLLREINVKNLGLPSWVIYFLGGAGRNWALGILWAILLVFFLVQRKEMTRIIFSWLKSAPGIILIIAGVFYLAGLPFDKKMLGISIEKHELLEEILEAQAALLMMIAAVFSFLQRRQNKTGVQ